MLKSSLYLHIGDTKQKQIVFLEMKTKICKSKNKKYNEQD